MPIDESISGPGSNMSETVAVRNMLPGLLKTLGVKTFLDAPCGDFNWMQAVDLGVDKYYGMDILVDRIRENIHNHQRPDREFMYGDIVWSDLPRVDLIFCRDCMVHLPYKGIFLALENFRHSGSTYLMATSYVTIDHNSDCSLWDWRKINLSIFPFMLGLPLYSIRESGSRCEPGGDDYGKTLGVWKLHA